MKVRVNTVPNALSIAKEFAKLASSGQEPDPLTNLRLQKLLYYAQSWSLVVRDSELFPETVEAWRLGPVVPEVYRFFRDGFGVSEITDTHFPSTPDLPPAEAEFVLSIWESYKQHSPPHLSKLTHQELPWRKTWGDRTTQGTGNDPISVSDMEEWFSKQAIPAPIAEYEHNLRTAEDDARNRIAAMPQFDPVMLAAKAVSRSISVPH